MRFPTQGLVEIITANVRKHVPDGESCFFL